MTINELNKKIEGLNAKVKDLNNANIQNIGKKEAMTKQLATALATYNEKHNKNINIGDIDKELALVIAEKEAEIANIEGILAKIESGESVTEEPEVDFGNTEIPTAQETPTQALTHTETSSLDFSEPVATEQTTPVSPVGAILPNEPILDPTSITPSSDFDFENFNPAPISFDDFSGVEFKL